MAHDYRDGQSTGSRAGVGVIPEAVLRLGAGGLAPEKPPKKTFFDKATEIIFGDREQTYGKPGKNLVLISKLWSEYIEGKYGEKYLLSAEDVCYMMILLKIARLANSHTDDNVIDVMGYAGLVERIRDNV